jgi:hypothetical protein
VTHLGYRPRLILEHCAQHREVRFLACDFALLRSDLRSFSSTIVVQALDASIDACAPDLASAAPQPSTMRSTALARC